MQDKKIIYIKMVIKFSLKNVSFDRIVFDGGGFWVLCNKKIY
jgi:hypothetical protein